jgi:hypothetical protein
LSELRMSFLFWVLVLFAIGFARYFFLARGSGDTQLAFAAAAAFFLTVLVAILELFGVVW